MQSPIIRIGTRESELAVWQANLVKDMFQYFGYASSLVFIKSEGDIDLKTPLYEMGVQGIFTRNLDTALLNNKIDVAVHSMKDVPTQLPLGVAKAAVLERGNYKDLFVPNNNTGYNKVILEDLPNSLANPVLQQPMNEVNTVSIATSSIRRKAQWLHRYPRHLLENLRGNVNTRLKKLDESNWAGAIFAAAGLERINLRPQNAVELDWMLPAPSQGAVMVLRRQIDEFITEASAKLNHNTTDLCTSIEKDFLRTLMGGCTTPISALAEIHQHELYFRGNILSADGKEKISVETTVGLNNSEGLGNKMALELLSNGGQEIADQFKHGK